MRNRHPELLIPASSLEVLKTAVMFGADAVYIGGEAFGLRAKAKNFTKEEMAEGIAFAHEHGVKVYVTANILAHNGDLEGVREYFEELKELIAHAASPKVDPENVSIAFSDSVDPYLASDRPVNLPKPDESGNPWWLAVALSAIGLIIVFRAVSNKVHQLQEANAIEVERLRQKEAEQDRELSDVNMRAAQLTDRQRELAEGLLEQQNREYIAIRSPQEMISALENMSANLDEADSEEAADKIKSWIEKG